jgi:glycerol-3-phosphate dehydrogenase
VAVLEKEADVAFGSSGRNSGVVHAGFNNRPGSLMAKLCVQGCEDFEKEAENLSVPFRRTGKYVLAFSDKDIATLNTLLDNGIKNGVKGLEIIRAAIEKDFS